MTFPKIIDNDRDEITAVFGGKEIRGWSYKDGDERRAKMKMAHEFVEGYGQGCALCEELADALGIGLALIEGTIEAMPGIVEGDKATGVYVTVPDEMRAALKASGRAPQ